MATQWDEGDTPRIPPSPAPRVLDHESRLALFGRPAWKPKPGGQPGEIVLDPAWVKKNLVTIRIPWAGVSSSGLSPDSRAVTVHRVCAQPMLKLWESWRDAGLLPLIRTWNGSWVPRMKRGYESSANPGDLSTHSWGGAFDINAPYNKLGQRGARVGQAGSVELLVPLAYEHDFAWGGDFKRTDAMHFEYAPKAFGKG